MNQHENETLDRFLQQVSAMHLHRSAKFGSALKKPLLLLLVISKLEHGDVLDNRFRFAELRSELESLIDRHGGRPSRSGAKPEQPFSHLRSSAFWNLTTPLPHATGTAVPVSQLMDKHSFASLDPELFALLTRSRDARVAAFQHILDQWWPESLHDDLRDDLGMPRDVVVTRVRSAQFVADVLANYRYSCAFCGFHALLNGRATGIDACHIKWHSALGPDTPENGIALCKLHHWAFDKGVMMLEGDLRIHVAPAFVVHVAGGLPIESLHGKSLCVPPRQSQPNVAHLEWHRTNIYLG